MSQISKLVREAFNSARDNGYAYEVMRDDHIADDLMQYDSYLENYAYRDILNAVKLIKRRTQAIRSSKNKMKKKLLAAREGKGLSIIGVAMFYRAGYRHQRYVYEWLTS